MSVITEGELRTGAARSSSPVKTLRLVENFLRPLVLIDFTSDDAITYASVRAKLERAARRSERAAVARSRRGTLIPYRVPITYLTTNDK